MAGTEAMKESIERVVGLSNQLLDNLSVMKQLHGERWPEVMADLGASLQHWMKTTGETNAFNAVFPIVKDMSAAGQNPLLLIAVATEIAKGPRVPRDSETSQPGDFA